MSQYRAFAKAVAIFDMVISSIALLLVIILAILAGTAASVAKDVSSANLHQFQQISSSNHPAAGVGGLVNAAVWMLCAVVALFAAITALQMLAAIRLLSATEIGREPVEAVRLASTWRNISIVFLVIDIIGFLVMGMYIAFAICLFLRGGMIYIVFRYMGELEMIINSVPVSVTIQK